MANKNTEQKIERDFSKGDYYDADPLNQQKSSFNYQRMIVACLAGIIGGAIMGYFFGGKIVIGAMVGCLSGFFYALPLGSNKPARSITTHNNHAKKHRKKK